MNEQSNNRSSPLDYIAAKKSTDYNSVEFNGVVDSKTLTKTKWSLTASLLQITAWKSISKIKAAKRNMLTSFKFNQN